MRLHVFYKYIRETISLLILFFISINLFAIEGTVKDLLGDPLDSVKVSIFNKDSSLKYVVYTDASGFYKVDVPEFSYKSSTEKKFELQRSYPNPFNNKAIVPVVVYEPGRVTMQIYDLQGRFIKRIIDKEFQMGVHFLEWDGKDHNKNMVRQGMYIYMITYRNEKYTGKLVRINSIQDPAPGYFKDIKNAKIDTTFYSYSVYIERNGMKPDSAFKVGSSDTVNFIMHFDVSAPYACQGNYIGVWNGDKYKKIFIKGINLGVAKPGTQPGQMAATRDDYHRWINRMSEMGVNSIRAYTIHFPRFYEVLDSFNMANPQNPIYLFQGIWLNEYEDNHNFYNLSKEFDADIEEVIDVVHGNREIGERSGRAFGKYKADVSSWVMGYIIGREIHPYEVIPTDTINHAVNGFSGRRIRIDSSSPTEAWIVARLDHLVDYERNTYQTGRPISFSSWPTMDPLDHPTEKVNNTDEDVTQFDLSNINMFDAPGGYFASFHAYPYYPDFISADTNYRKYTDIVNGVITPNSYVGYLFDLKRHYSQMPLLIAEFGAPSSYGNAHFAHSGINHGGNDENEQGLHDARLIRNIYNTDCAGGMLFSWIDEWFKITWITNPIGTVASRRHFWHNLTSPEQNFGLLTFDPPEPDFKPLQLYNVNCDVDSVFWATDWQYVRLKLKLSSHFKSTDKLLIAFDTYKPDVGEKYLPNGHPVSTRPEFVLEIKYSDVAKLYVTQAYDLFEKWFTGWADPAQKFYPTVTNGAPWHVVRWRNDEDSNAIDSLGLLRVRWPNGDSTSLDAVLMNGDEVEIRIPWTLLNFTDPSLREIMHDSRLTPEREVRYTDGINIGVHFRGCFNQAEKFTWLQWDASDGYEYYEREKPALQIYSDEIKKLPYWIK